MLVLTFFNGMKDYNTIEELKKSFNEYSGFGLKSTTSDDLVTEIDGIRQNLECEVNDICCNYERQVKRLLSDETK